MPEILFVKDDNNTAMGEQYSLAAALTRRAAC